MAHRLLVTTGMAWVLVAEDDPEMRRLVVEELRKDGHAVSEAVDGAGLFARLAESLEGDLSASGIDCIVSDVRMPASSALDILEGFVEGHRGVHIVLMTAFGDDEVHRRAERLGAFVFDKPLSLRELRETVWRITT